MRSATSRLEYLNGKSLPSIQSRKMANFEENVMVASYWGGEIISEMSGYRYSEGAIMIVSMSISTSYVELVAMLHEKMRTNSENIQMDISGKYPCSFQGNVTRFIEFKIENDQSLLQFLVIPQKFSNKIDINLLEMYVKTRPTNHDNLFQMNGQHGYHMNLLAQNYGFAMLSHPHFAYTATPSIHQSLDAIPNEHEYQSYDEGLSSQGHIESGHRQYEIRWVIFTFFETIRNLMHHCFTNSLLFFPQRR
ncbi:uncharacterized protein LOC107865655 isoform X1 [Capsicum annuum]|uniref:uncharacterized protein LOC107865655 isoform X1 n=1 Tax=Capsicum annuum TaxID=4072 RepID=UPI001FB06F95|nr:uncharacterized protein LOC107865655 isoform X1 [Capsicum annuum]